MDRDSDRTPRVKRYRTDAEDVQVDDSVQQEQGDGAPRRRRSQAARLRMEETNMGDTITPPSRAELETQRRYGRPEVPRQQQRAPAPKQPQRQLPPRDPYDDDGYDDDGYDPYAKPAPSKRAPAKQPAAKGKKRELYDDDAYDDRYDDRYDDDRYDDDGYGDDDDPYGRGYDDYDDDEPPRKKRKVWLIVAIVVLLVVGIVTVVALRNPGGVVEPVVQFFSGIFGGEATPEPEPTPFATEEPTPEPAPDVNAAVVISFTADPFVQPDLDEAVEFRITTTMQTTRVEIIADGDNGQTIAEASGDEYTDTDSGRIWSLRVYFPEAFEGTVVAYPGNEAGWNNASTSSILIKVGDPSAVPPEETQAPDGQTGGEGTQTGTGQGTLGTALGAASQVQRVDVQGQAFTTTDGQVDSYTREHMIDMGDADDYRGADGMKGVLTFRGSNLRQNAAYGTVASALGTLESVWTAQAGMASSGDNANGSQPIIVQWHQDIRALMTLNGDKQNVAELREVIFAGNNGNLYFYDLADGQATRDALPINPLMPMFGTPSAYPFGYPMVLVGSGDPADTTMEAGTGYLVYHMIKNADIGMLPGQSDDAFSQNRAVVTSPLIDNDSDTMLGIGGNGLLFTMRLNTQMNGEDKSMIIAPTVDVYRGGSEGQDTSVDSSLAGYGEYIYYATNGGILQCVNVNTLTPIWALNVGADTDAAVAMRVTASGPVLFLATKADVEGLAHMRCIDAMTGSVLWDYAFAGSISASPVVGTGALDGVVVLAAAVAEGGGKVIALQADTGDVLWEYATNSNRLASPLALYSEDRATAWIVQGDGNGLALLDASTGSQLSFLALDGALYGSPAAFGNMIVAATTTGTLHGVRIN